MRKLHILRYSNILCIELAVGNSFNLLMKHILDVKYDLKLKIWEE